MVLYSALPELSCRFSACSLLSATWEWRRLRLFCKFSRKINPGRPKGTNRDPNKPEPPKQVREPWGVSSSLRLACYCRQNAVARKALPAFAHPGRCRCVSSASAVGRVAAAVLPLRDDVAPLVLEPRCKTSS